MVMHDLRNFQLPAEPHGDITAHNFIYDGKDLFLIDGREGWPFSDADGLQDTIAKVEALLL
jgi:hypothetical protein